MSGNLQKQLGPIDIYLFDQMLRGRIAPGMRIFDAGCGSGRNLIYFLRESYEVFGVDADPRANNVRAETIEGTSFGEAFAGFAINSAVLHFARDDSHFDAMLRGTWRVLKPGGLFFCRLASSIGIENQVKRVASANRGRRFLLPDGTERYLVDEALLIALTKELGGQLADHLKTTVA